MDTIPISQIDTKGLIIDPYRTTVSGNAYIGSGAVLDLTTGRAHVVKEQVVKLPYLDMNYIYYDLAMERYDVSNILLKDLDNRKLLFIITKRDNNTVDKIINASDIKNRNLEVPNMADQVYSSDTEYALKIEGDKITVKNHNINRVSELYIHKIGVVMSKSIISVQGKSIILDGNEMDGKLCDVSYLW